MTSVNNSDQLANLGFLAVYFDTDSSCLAQLAHPEAVEKLSSLVSKVPILLNQITNQRVDLSSRVFAGAPVHLESRLGTRQGESFYIPTPQSSDLTFRRSR